VRGRNITIGVPLGKLGAGVSLQWLANDDNNATSPSLVSSCRRAEAGVEAGAVAGAEAGAVAGV
jgi:hypothetical protein